MARSKRVFSPEFREDAVKLVIDSSGPIAQVARELGIGEATLGNWVNKYRRDHAGEEAPLSVSDRARLREVERQLREIRMENEFLKKAASSRRSIGEHQVWVHLQRRRQLPDRVHVQVGEGVSVGLL
jgi:transposase